MIYPQQVLLALHLAVRRQINLGMVSLLWISLLILTAYGQEQDDGSRCPNTSCSPPIPGASCTPNYSRDDGCCPVWRCNQNGVISEIYGKSSFSSSSSSWSSSSSSGGGGYGMPSSPGLNFPGFQMPNFGNMFGRRRRR